MRNKKHSVFLCHTWHDEDRARVARVLEEVRGYGFSTHPLVCSVPASDEGLKPVMLRRIEDSMQQSYVVLIVCHGSEVPEWLIDLGRETTERDPVVAVVGAGQKKLIAGAGSGLVHISEAVSDEESKELCLRIRGVGIDEPRIRIAARDRKKIVERARQKLNVDWKRIGIKEQPRRRIDGCQFIDVPSVVQSDEGRMEKRVGTKELKSVTDGVNRELKSLAQTYVCGPQLERLRPLQEEVDTLEGNGERVFHQMSGAKKVVCFVAMQFKKWDSKRERNVVMEMDCWLKHRKVVTWFFMRRNDPDHALNHRSLCAVGSGFGRLEQILEERNGKECIVYQCGKGRGNHMESVGKLEEWSLRRIVGSLKLGQQTFDSNDSAAVLDSKRCSIYGVANAATPLRVLAGGKRKERLSAQGFADLVGMMAEECWKDCKVHPVWDLFHVASGKADLRGQGVPKEGCLTGMDCGVCSSEPDVATRWLGELVAERRSFDRSGPVEVKDEETDEVVSLDYEINASTKTEDVMQCDLVRDGTRMPTKGIEEILVGLPADVSVKFSRG